MQLGACRNPTDRRRTRFCAFSLGRSMTWRRWQTDKCIEYAAHGACDVSIKCRGMNKAAMAERRRRRQYSAVSDALNEHALDRGSDECSTWSLYICHATPPPLPDSYPASGNVSTGILRSSRTFRERRDPEEMTCDATFMERTEYKLVTLWKTVLLMIYYHYYHFYYYCWLFYYARRQHITCHSYKHQKKTPETKK